jgi:hypothetical protein
MPFESMGNKKMSINEAAAQIMAIRSQTEVMGANDYEGSALTQLQRRLQEGELEPEEAVKQANGILGSKQDYH